MDCPKKFPGFVCLIWGLGFGERKGFPFGELQRRNLVAGAGGEYDRGGLVVDSFESCGCDQGQSAEGESVVVGGGSEGEGDSEGAVEERGALGVV